ncbi:MAG: hypothetical protein ACXW15_05785 [Acidimicrobiia bacterium]
MASVISVERLRKTYGAFVAVEDVSFDVEPWLSGEWAVGYSAAVLAIGGLSAVAAYLLFKWE